MYYYLIYDLWVSIKSKFTLQYTFSVQTEVGSRIHLDCIHIKIRCNLQISTNIRCIENEKKYWSTSKNIIVNICNHICLIICNILDFFHPLRMRSLLSIHYFFLVMTSFAVKWLYFVSVITYLTYNVATLFMYMNTT